MLFSDWLGLKVVNRNSLQLENLHSCANHSSKPAFQSISTPVFTQRDDRQTGLFSNPFSSKQMCTTTYVKYLGRKLKFDCIKSFTNISSSSSVSKTTRELQLFWSESHDPVSVATDLKMPQFTIEKVAPTVCNEQFHMGEGEDGKQFLTQLPV